MDFLGMEGVRWREGGRLWDERGVWKEMDIWDLRA